MLRVGAAGAGGLLLSSAAASQTLWSGATTGMRVDLAPGLKPYQPAAAIQAPAGVNPQLFQRALAALDSHRPYVAARDFVGIVDFSLPSDQPRFHVVHLPSNTVESHLVAHGRGSDPDHSGFLERFSNDYGSYATAQGAYITDGTYDGKYGLSMKVAGLDATNNNALGRAIVIHNAWYAEPDMVQEHGKLGRSEGCFAFGRKSQWAVMGRLGGGRMIYADKIA
ncbi:murein L,D-transpeptidase catalytic domain family protein [Sphingomonas sp. ASV193]|uniref:murein L,D-transpeptidase catalytic domain family protein n=1 Tax=Sphingomonas sp. ASV193 TaxID=3144405 RepID=UPI0032E91878